MSESVFHRRSCSIRHLGLGVIMLWLALSGLLIYSCSQKTVRWSVEVGPPDGGKYRGIAAGDFNGDGYIDLAGGNFRTGGVTIYWGRGDGTWIYMDKASKLGEIRSMESADFDEDGFDDIAVTTWGDLKGVHIYLSDGKGKWKEGMSPVESWSYEGIDVSDMNNDGHMDIIAANSTSELAGGISVWFNNGNAVWTTDYGTIQGEVFKDVAIADFNQDGFKDIVATTWGIHGGIRVWYGNGRGDWRRAEAPREEADFWGVDAADLNGDGYPDIIAGTYMEGLAVWYGGPRYGFRKWDHIKTTGSIWGVVAEDFDGDGYIDIAASSFDDDGIIYFHNDGKGGWDDYSYQFVCENRYFGLTTADINRDGLPDLAAAHPGEGLHVWVQGIGDLYGEPLGVESTDLFQKRKVLVTENDRSFSIYFDTAEWDIKMDQFTEMNKIVNLLRLYPESIIQLEGHTDIRDVIHHPVLKSNMELSEKRGNSVLEALVDSTGIKMDQFRMAGMGELYLIAADSADYWLDRRVDIFVSPMKYEVEQVFRGRNPKALLLSDGFVQTMVESLAVETVDNAVYTTISGYPEYKVDPNDVLNISIWEGRTQKEYLVRVQVDGTISFAYTTDMYVQDLTPTQIREKILEQSREFLRRPNVNVDVIEYNSKKASILGQVRDLQRSDTGPGQYPLMGKTHVVDFISRHGGPTDKADLAQVKVVRANGRTLFLNIYQAMFEGDVKQNIILDDGDVVYLPLLSVSARKFYVLGEVVRPGIYELADELNILEAVMMAGGFTDRASLGGIAVIRGDLTKPEVAVVNLDKLIHKGDQSENIEVHTNDIIYVSRHFIGDVNYVMSQIVPSLNTLFLLDRMSK